MKRTIAWVLLLAALLGLALPAAGQEVVWAREAVDFCVEQGLLDGENLRLAEPATRAELATMLTRLLALEERASLAAYSDVLPAAWYYDAMAAAVAAGLLEGEGGTLNPNGDLTREAAMTVLARAFGVAGSDAEALAGFSDSWQLDDWAVEPVASLVAQGYVSGSGGQLQPQAPMTRQEAAHLLYRLAGAVVREPEDLPETGSAVLLADALEDVQVEGSLYLGGQAETVLDNVQVSGTIVVHGGTLRMTGGSTAGEIVTMGQATVVTEGNTPVRVAGGRATVSGGGDVTAEGDVVLAEGTFATLTLLGGEARVEADAAVTEARLAGRDSRLTGEGAVEQALVTKRGCRVETAGTAVTEEVDPGLAGAVLTIAVQQEPTPTREMVATVTLSGVTGPDGRYGTLTWYGGGSLAGRQLRVPLAEGASVTVTAPGDYTGRVEATQTLRVQLTYDGESVEASQTVNQHREQLKTSVRTLEVEATVRRDTGLYRNVGLTGFIRTVPAGTVAVYYDYYGTTYGKIRLDDGTTGWVRWSDLSISSKDYVQYTDYSTEEKENFVNSIGYESDTAYLVWVSLLTQKVNVFRRANGEWYLLHTFACCSGKNTTPTEGGVFRYHSRQNYWDFGSYYVNRPMIFNGGHAFHTRTYIKGTSRLLDDTMGRPASQGCVRMYDADVNWLWDNMPFGTTVVVF